jgi:hypothetical protein
MFLLEKLIFGQHVKKLLAFYATRRFITIFTTIRISPLFVILPNLFGVFWYLTAMYAQLSQITTFIFGECQSQVIPLGRVIGVFQTQVWKQHKWSAFSFQIIPNKKRITEEFTLQLLRFWVKRISFSFVCISNTEKIYSSLFITE